MQIINEKPSDWKNLQDLVCKYLRESGYYAESPKTIATVRGNVEVDVYAESQDELIKKFVCECKFWNKKVPKEKVHAFRTVVADSGSMLGILISKKGFQSGAIEAAYCSNVLLKDWDGFVKLIEKQWIQRQGYLLKKKGALLFRLTDSYKLLDDMYLTDTDYHNLVNIGRNHNVAMFVARSFNKEDIARSELNILSDLKFCSCSELFNYLNTNINTALDDCTEILEKYNKSTDEYLRDLINLPENFANSIVYDQ